MILAALLFIRRVADTTTVAAVTDEYIEDGLRAQPAGKKIPPYVRVFRIHGPFLFGATDKLQPRSATTSPTLPPDRRPAAAQHDRDRRHRPAGARGSRRPRCTSRGASCCSAARGSSRPT